MHRRNLFGNGLVNVEYAKSIRSKRREQSGSRRYSSSPGWNSEDSRHFNLNPNKRLFLGALPNDLYESDIRDKF